MSLFGTEDVVGIKSSETKYFCSTSLGLRAQLDLHYPFGIMLVEFYQSVTID